MNATHWQKVKGILEEVLEAPPESRSAFVNSICSGDAELRREVESLLDFEGASADPLEDSAVSAFTQNGNGGHKTALIGQQIGKYKIISELGKGGMGVVFLAERADGSFDQKVALKLIKHGIGSDSARRRFVTERQILASLQHPNIAHLIDGGTTDDDLPYFVMEYVEGETILEFARRENLDVGGRLDLFRQVCAAVSFAHKNLVIHRDLKPSNIFVGPDGVPKLLDFGIAKLLKTEFTDQTATRQFAFTPEYASPEQVRGESLTTATDVYSLGVILYELLTGRRPFTFENKNFGQIVQTVTQTDPVKPSDAGTRRRRDAWRRGEGEKETPGDEVYVNDDVSISASLGLGVPASQLRGDLDNIVLKSLKRDTERRYSSVEQFSEDIRRHLRGLPVLARQDTLGYRADKFARRNPFVVGAVALAFLILIGGIVAVGWQYRIANAERAKAERRFNDVRNLANSFIFEVNEKIVESPIQARELLVTRAIEYLDNLAAEAEGDADLQSELAAAYEKIGDVQSELFSPSLGKTSESLISHQKALAIREKLFSAEPNNISRGLNVSKSISGVGDILSMSGRVAEAAESYRRAIRLNESLLTLDKTNIAARRSMASNYGRLGQAVLRSGSLGDSLANYNKSLEIYHKLYADNPTDRTLQRSLSIMYSYIGYARMEMGEYEESVRFFRDSLDLAQKRLADDRGQQTRGAVGTAHLWLGVALAEQGKPDEALSQIRRALEIQTAIFGADRGNFGEQNALADTYLEIGRASAIKAEIQAATRATSSDSAIKAYETAIKNYETVWQTDRQNFSVHRQIAFARRYLADGWRLKGDKAKALHIFREALAEFEELTQNDANNTEWQHDLAYCNLRIGQILSESGDKQKADLHLEKAYLLLAKLSAASPENVRIRRDLETVNKGMMN